MQHVVMMIDSHQKQRSKQPKHSCCERLHVENTAAGRVFEMEPMMAGWLGLYHHLPSRALRLTCHAASGESIKPKEVSVITFTAVITARKGPTRVVVDASTRLKPYNDL